MRVAIYARVSTNKKKKNPTAEDERVQNPDTQLLPLRDYAGARQYEIFAEYVDRLTGSKESRPALDRLMADARARRFDVIAVARFDRFARSTRHLVMALEEFQALKIDFVSINESIDTSTPMGKMVFTVIAAVAELERSLIRERVIAGLARAEREGKQFGRREKIVDKEKVRAHYAESGSLRKTGEHFNIGKDKVKEICQ